MHNWFREIKDFVRLLDDSGNDRIQIAFYSERNTYFQYYETLLAAVAAKSGPDIHYITSDPMDRTLSGQYPNIKAFYIDRSLAVVMQKLRARVVVMTMPDLGVYHIKRSPDVAHYVYVFHGVSSTHAGYGPHAFDHYDTIFCLGPHNVAELRRAESLYGIKPRRLIECGYPRLDAIYREHQSRPPGDPYILAASTWGTSSLLGTYADALIDTLAALPYRCVVRPHPEYIKRQPADVARLRQRIERHPNLALDLGPEADLHNAQVLICDPSGILSDYAFGTERPALVMDVPERVENPRMTELGLPPVSDVPDMARRISMAELAELPRLLQELHSDLPTWQERIVACRNRTVFNWLNSAEVGADALLELCQTPVASH